MRQRTAIARLVCIAVIAVAGMIFSSHATLAQGFMVKPMRIEAAPRAGQTIELPLEIRNTAGDAVRPIELRLVELSQAPGGSWIIGKADNIRPSSASGWTSLSTNRLEIDPLAPAEVMVRFSPPITAKGAYVVGVIAETPAAEQANGLSIRMRFLIPVIVEIEGRPVRQQIALEDVVMTYNDGSDGKPATTEAHLKIVNAGQTFSRVSGKLAIERKNGDRWRTVTRFDVQERSIIPGVTLELGQDLQRRLPPGDYRLHGELTVDGRRVAPLEKEIAFAGDPNASLAYDTALVLEPELVDMAIVPGATRTATLRVENPGTDPVTVKMAARTPRGLIGVELGELSGVELSAEPWTSIQPAEFTIRPGGKQNVRVMSRIPNEGVDHPHYYADLVLGGTYADGQSAGETRSTIHLSQDKIASKPAGVVEQISLSESETPSRYIVDIRFANIGDVHLTTNAKAYLLSAQGVQVRNATLSGEEGSLLPLGKRAFSGELDLAGIEPGYYALRARVGATGNLEFAGQQIVLIENEQQVAADGNALSVIRATLVDPATADVPDGLDAAIGEGNVLPLDDPSNEGTGDAG